LASFSQSNRIYRKNVASPLFVLCDGCYEIRNASGDMADYKVFEAFMTGNAGATDPLGDLESWAIAMRGESTLEDDFSIIEIQFPA